MSGWSCCRSSRSPCSRVAGAATFTHRFPAHDADLQGNLRASLLLALAAAMLFRAAWSMKAPEVRFAMIGIVFLLLVDLTAYFQSASRIDMRFTQLRGWAGVVPSPAERAALARPWPPPDPTRGFGGGLESAMPISNQFWPFNRFMLPADLPREATAKFPTFVRAAPPFAFYCGARASPRDETMPEAIAANPASIDRELLVVAPQAPTAPASPAVREGFTYGWKWLDYNAFEIEALAPCD